MKRIISLFVILIIMFSAGAFADLSDAQELAREYEQALYGNWKRIGVEDLNAKPKFKSLSIDPASDSPKFSVCVNEIGQAYLVEIVYLYGSVFDADVLGEIFLSENGNLLMLKAEDGMSILMRQ